LNGSMTGNKKVISIHKGKNRHLDSFPKIWQKKTMLTK